VYAHELHAYELHAHKVHAREVHTREISAHEVHACEMHVYEAHTHEVHNCEVHAHEVRSVLNSRLSRLSRPKTVPTAISSSRDQLTSIPTKPTACLGRKGSRGGERV
jgi:hypothetical protein